MPWFGQASSLTRVGCPCRNLNQLHRPRCGRGKLKPCFGILLWQSSLRVDMGHALSHAVRHTKQETFQATVLEFRKICQRLESTLNGLSKWQTPWPEAILTANKFELQDLTFHNNRIKKLHKLHCRVCHNCQASLANIASLQRSKYRMTFWAGAIAKACWSRGKSIYIYIYITTSTLHHDLLWLRNDRPRAGKQNETISGHGAPYSSFETPATERSPKSMKVTRIYKSIANSANRQTYANLPNIIEKYWKQRTPTRPLDGPKMPRQSWRSASGAMWLGVPHLTEFTEAAQVQTRKKV